VQLQLVFQDEGILAERALHGSEISEAREDLPQTFTVFHSQVSITINTLIGAHTGLLYFGCNDTTVPPSNSDNLMS